MSEAITAAIAIIKDNAALAAAFGDRIRTGRAAEIDQTPYCLLWTIFTNATDALDGEQDLDTSLIQIDVYSTRFGGALGANLLAAQIRDAMARFGRGKVANVFVSSIVRVNGPRQTTERYGTGADEALSRVSLDYRLHHSITRSD